MGTPRLRGRRPVRIVRGDLRTMDATRPRAEAMAVDGDRIVAVGGLDEVTAATGPGAEVANVPGVVLPAFTDSHVHMLYAGLELRRLDLSAVRSVEELLGALRRATSAAAPDEWLHAVGNFELEDLAERRYPTREELDAATAAVRCSSTSARTTRS